VPRELGIRFSYDLLVCYMIRKEREGDIVYLPYRMNKKGLNERNGVSTGYLSSVANTCLTTWMGLLTLIQGYSYVATTLLHSYFHFSSTTSRRQTACR